MPQTTDVDKGMVLTILRTARERITDPEHWTQFRAAVDARGERTRSWGGDAVRWCADGALAWAEYHQQAPEHTYPALVAAETAMSAAARVWLTGKVAEDLRAHLITPYLTVNDQHGHAAILTVFDAAMVEVQAWP